MFFVLILIHLWLIYFFWKINFLYWVYFISFILSILIVLSLLTDSGKSSWKILLKDFFLKYLIYINFIIILVWLFFISKYFLSQQFGTGILTDIKAIFLILWVNIFVLLISAILDKEWWIKKAYFWFIILWLYLYYLVQDPKIFNYFIVFILSVSIVWYLLNLLKHKYNKFLLYIIFLSSITLFFIFLNKIFIHSDILLSLSIQITMSIILLWIIYYKNKYEKLLEILQKHKEYKNELNLFGYSDKNLKKNEEKILKNPYNENYRIIVDFFINSPNFVKILFSLTNTIPVIYASIYFFNHMQIWNKLLNESLYWAGAIIFFINFLLFKKLNWFVAIQRLLAFFVMNFVAYFTITDFFWKNYIYITIWWILWNLFTTVIILFLWKKDSIFNHTDYIIWSIVNFAWVFINMYFLIKLNLNYYLLSWIMLLYLWAYLYLYRIIYKKVFL